MVHCIKLIVTTWELSDANLRLFHADDGMAIGVYNESLFIIGGYRNRKQATEYRWKSPANPLNNLGNDILNADIYGYGQFWVQKDNILYLIQPDTPNHIATYNMATNQFTANTITITNNVWESACLALSDPYLYVIGGWDGNSALNTVQVLDLSLYQWTSNAPSMIDAREATACIVHNDYLWAFGGWGVEPLKTNERINVINTTQNNWEYIDALFYAAAALRCVSWGEMIYIIGGRTDSDGYLDIVYIMDGKTGKITESADKTSFPTAYSSPVIVDGVLYLFGGNPSKDWMYYTLATTTPITTSIMMSSSVAPSNVPTDIPSVSTGNPTQTPSKNPIHSASTAPFYSPSISPSIHPTVNPSYSPSLSPFPTMFNTTMMDSVMYKSTQNMYYRPRHNQYDIITVLLVLIGVVIAIIVLILTVWIFYCMRKRIMKVKKNLEKNMETASIDEDKVPELCYVNDINLERDYKMEGKKATMDVSDEYRNDNIGSDEFIVKGDDENTNQSTLK